MYRNSNASRREDWENRNQSQRGNNNMQHYQNYGADRDRNRNNYEDYNRRQPYNQSRQDNNYGYDQPQRSRSRYEDFRGSYRLDNEGNVAGYRQLNDRNYGPDYGYGHAGNSRTGGDYGRHQSEYGTGATYGASRNAGSMGSYGGAQGFGSSRNGYHNERWASGHYENNLRPERRLYG